MKMIAEGKFKHTNGKWLKNGDKFTTDEVNGEDLRAMGFARKDLEAEDTPPQTEEAAVGAEENVSNTGRRTFRHRAMKSEE